jgi:hypothetical protein
MQDCPASSQSGTGMNKEANAGTSPVLELGINSGTGIPEMSDAGGIGLDAGAQLCLLV